MSAPSLNVLAVAGSLNRNSSTRAVINLIAQQLTVSGARVDMLDLGAEPMTLFDPDSSHTHESFPRLKARVEQADVYLLGTPDYHGSMSGAMKIF